MRILDNSTARLDLADLGFSEANYERYSQSFTKPYGMILVTGPTGSGKSTTLYATLNIVSRPEVNVITVEDPVEYRLPGINQVQTNTKAGLTFASALRSILRSDPDIVLIGEIRDHETGADRGRGRPHRSPRALDPAHQRRAVAPSPGSPRWASSRSSSGRRWTRAGPAARPAAVHEVQGGVHADAASRWRRPGSRGRTGEPTARAVPAGRLLGLRQDRLQGPAGAARGHGGHRGDRAAGRREGLGHGDRERRQGAGHEDPARGRLAKVLAGVTSLEEILRVVV